MKKITITKALRVTDIGDENPKLTGLEIEGGEDMEASDGYHTFGELYEHRITLFIALCKNIQQFQIETRELSWPERKVWRSKLHSDGTNFGGWFILGINREKGKQITYHLPLSKWEETEFAETLDKAPEWDGHTPQDVLDRLKSL